MKTNVIYEKTAISKCKSNNEYILYSGKQMVYNRYEKFICEVHLAMNEKL